MTAASGVREQLVDNGYAAFEKVRWTRTDAGGGLYPGIWPEPERRIVEPLLPLYQGNSVPGGQGEESEDHQWWSIDRLPCTRERRGVATGAGSPRDGRKGDA
jgi:hypothetical protein